MTIPHEILVWENESPVVCIGADFDFDTLVNDQTKSKGIDICIDESWNPDRRRAQIF